jgi:hypothetical protein
MSTYSRYSTICTKPPIFPIKVRTPSFLHSCLSLLQSLYNSNFTSLASLVASPTLCSHPSLPGIGPMVTTYGSDSWLVHPTLQSTLHVVIMYLRQELSYSGWMSCLSARFHAGHLFSRSFVLTKATSFASLDAARMAYEMFTRGMLKKADYCNCNS